MRRIVRVSLDVVGLRDTEPNYALVIGEQIRTASWRTVCDLSTGEFIRPDDLALALQIHEDVLEAAIGRTIGMAQTLEF